jgi:pimeloyl-ACP methyl ester carboxylesterase
MGAARSRGRKVLKPVLIGCGTVVALIIVLVVMAGLWLFPRSGDIGESGHHPFRSVEAKQRYLRRYDARAQTWPVLSESRMVPTSYGPTFVRISGPTGGPPLVLLHGIGGSSLQWEPNIAALSDSYRTYAVDNIYDYGRSVYTRPITGPHDFIVWLDDLFDALELGENINLVGLSYGGWLASQYALEHPERLGGIVLLAPAATVMPIEPEWLARAALCVIPHRRLTESFLSWLLPDMARGGDDDRAMLSGWVEDSFVAMRSFKPKRMVNPTVLRDEELQSIMVPTLYLVGANERIYSAQEAVERLNTVAPHIETEIIPRAGHDLTYVQAELVNGRILEFLGRTARIESANR